MNIYLFVQLLAWCQQKKLLTGYFEMLYKQFTAEIHLSLHHTHNTYLLASSTELSAATPRFYLSPDAPTPQSFSSHMLKMDFRQFFFFFFPSILDSQ